MVGIVSSPYIYVEFIISTTEEVAERTGRRRSYKRSSSSSSESRRNRHQSSKQKSEAKSEIAGSGSSKKKAPSETPNPLFRSIFLFDSPLMQESKREKRISKTFSISDIDEGDEAVVEPASPPNADLPLPMPSPKADNINTISSSDHMAWDELSKEVSQEAKESVKAEILSQLERELAMDIEVNLHFLLVFGYFISYQWVFIAFGMDCGCAAVCVEIGNPRAIPLGCDLAFSRCACFSL